MKTAKQAVEKEVKTVKKAVTKKAAPAKAAAKKAADNLSKLPGVGPATAKKLAEAGITSFKQVANPSAADKKKLEAFAKTKGFADWTAKAKELI
ncbi:helix-hairpin-helix domain-containing protein [Oleiphilus sp. HI0067]|uniref:helix-hairpin-helix domain-containing protein n=1 Tax=Oleiphilus sp. HI0067 TaxID=1822243 RepID=UPI003511ADA5